MPNLCAPSLVSISIGFDFLQPCGVTMTTVSTLIKGFTGTIVPHPFRSRLPASMVALFAGLGEIRASIRMIILASLGSGPSRPTPSIMVATS